MQKKIGTYLHLYLGCMVTCSTKDFPNQKHTGKIVDVSTAGSNHSPWVKVAFKTCVDVCRDSFRGGDASSNMHHFFIESDEIKPILRPLWNMTEEDVYNLLCIKYWRMEWTVETTDIGKRWFHYRTHNGKRYSKSKSHSFPYIPENAEQTLYCLNSHFDLFGLIDAGLAIDLTTLNPKDNG